MSLKSKLSALAGKLTAHHRMQLKELLQLTTMLDRSIARFSGGTIPPQQRATREQESCHGDRPQHPGHFLSHGQEW